MLSCLQKASRRRSFDYFKVICIVRLQHAQVQSKETAVKDFSEIPQPKSLPILGTFLDYTKFRGFNVANLSNLFKARFDELGPIYKETIIPGLSEPTVHCFSPQDNEKLFRLESRLANRDPIEFLKVVRERIGVPSGLVNIQGEEWYQLRRIVNEHFLTNSSVWSYSKDIHEVSEDFVDYISRSLDSNNEVPNFALALNKWALEGAGVFSLDTRFGNLYYLNVEEHLQEIVDNSNLMFQLMAELTVAPPFWKYFETKQIRVSFLKALKQCQAAQVAAIKKQRDILLKRIKEKDPEKLTKLEKLMTKKDLPQGEVDILVSDMLGGGVDTTSNAAAFMLYIMAVNPDKQEILREEIKTALQSGKVDGKSLQRMKYLHACALEAQRMFPLTPGTSRRLPVDVVLSGYNVPAGTRLLLLSNVAHHKNPEYFDQPESFLPERWLERKHKSKQEWSNFMSTRSGFAMIGSFGMGARACPGRKFAMQEVHYLLISLLSRYKVEYHHKPIKPHFRLVTVPSEEPQFTFIPL
uniref:Cytochrome P450 10-like n=1 Tax=Ciona intestinalis TaxID=7719 RepID=H2XUM5_CIOIN